jgi:hypothetical protein
MALPPPRDLQHLGRQQEDEALAVISMYQQLDTAIFMMWLLIS